MTDTNNRYSVIRVEGIPPTVNHYVKHTRLGIHYKTTRARSWEQKVALACRGVAPVYGKTFEIEITVMFGKGERGDWDNFGKVVCDPIAKCGMLRNVKTGKPMSDAHIKRGTVHLDRGEKSMTTIEIFGVNS